MGSSQSENPPTGPRSTPIGLNTDSVAHPTFHLLLDGFARQEGQLSEAVAPREVAQQMILSVVVLQDRDAPGLENERRPARPPLAEEEIAFGNAGLADYRIEGGRIRVPQQQRAEMRTTSQFWQ